MGQPVACAIGPDTGPDEEVRLAPSPNEIRADFRLLKVKGVISSFPISSQRCNLKFPNLVRLETGNMELTLRVWDSYLRNPNTQGRPFKIELGKKQSHGRKFQALAEIPSERNKREKARELFSRKPDSEPTPLRSCVEIRSGSKSALDSYAHAYPLWWGRFGRLLAKIALGIRPELADRSS